jgi:hypothetical protein
MLEESDGPRPEYYEWRQNAEAHTTEGYHRADYILQKANKRTKKGSHPVERVEARLISLARPKIDD